MNKQAAYELGVQLALRDAGIAKKADIEDILENVQEFREDYPGAVGGGLGALLGGGAGALMSKDNRIPGAIGGALAGGALGAGGDIAAQKIQEAIDRAKSARRWGIANFFLR